MQDRKLSENFYLSEFKYVEPDPRLLTLLQSIRTEFGFPLKITDSARTVKEHIETYKKIYGDNWLDKIPWGSRHLPSFGKMLRAVDFSVLDKDDNGNVECVSGETVSAVARVLSKNMNINIGLGVGSTFIHLDVDRENNAEWKYSY